MKLHTHYHCIVDLRYCLVLKTKYQKKCLSGDILEHLEKTTKRICEKWDTDLIAFQGYSDHVYIFFVAYPSVDLSRLVNNIKTVTSRMTRKNFSDHLCRFYEENTLWCRGYCLLSYSQNQEDAIKKHIEDILNTILNA